MCTSNRSQMAQAIVAYLAEHSAAQDTIEGITEWWVLEHHIKFQIAEVKEAVAELVAQGLVVERQSGDGRSFYRLNRRRSRAIRAIIKPKSAKI